MADAFTVRPYARDDRARLLALLAQVWPHRPDLEQHVSRRWWWQRPEPPLVVVEDTGTRALVGLCAWLPFTVRAGGQEQPCAWFVDFYVLPAHQGRGLGRRLTRAVTDRFPLTASLSQTLMAYRVFQKLGWSERTRVVLHMNPWPSRSKRAAPAPGLQVSTCAIDAAGPVAADLDALWMRVRDAFGAIAVRDAAQLAERYAGGGGREYVLFCARRGRDCVGRMVVRLVPPSSRDRRPAQGLIVDYLTQPDDTEALAGLLSDATAHLTGRGARRIYCLSTQPADGRLLRSRGFLSPDTPLIGWRLRSQEKWLTYYAAPGAPRLDPSQWFLTLGDCDLDYAW